MINPNIVFTSPRVAEVIDKPVPSPGPGEVLVRAARSCSRKDGSPARRAKRHSSPQINFEATENTKEHKAFVNSVFFVAKSNWQLALAIGNTFTLATFFNLAFARRFARLEPTNAKGRDKAKSSIMANPYHPANQHTLPATGHLR